jgi:hypothetical protein
MNKFMNFRLAVFFFFFFVLFPLLRKISIDYFFPPSVRDKKKEWATNNARESRWAQHLLLEKLFDKISNC